MKGWSPLMADRLIPRAAGCATYERARTVACSCSRKIFLSVFASLR
jgi:hypothetical protein